MIKHRKTILFLLLAYALFIVGIYDVRADTGSISFTDGTSYACYDGSGSTGGCTSMTLNYFRKNNTTWLNYNAPSNYFYSSNSVVTYFTNNNMSTIDTKNYDYVLVHIITYGGIVPNSILVGNAYGYNMSTNLTQNVCFNSYQTGSGDICYDSVYDSIMKIDTSTNQSIGGQIKIYFSANGGGYVSDNSRIFIAELVYLGKTGDSMSSTIASNTTDINNKLSDSTIDNNNTSSSTTSWGNKNTSNSTITNLVTLPIQLLQAYTNGMSGTCSSFNLGNLFGTNITLPCINIGNLIGNSLWTTIDILFSGFMIFAIAKKLIKIFNDFTNLRSNQVDELYGGGA